MAKKEPLRINRRELRKTLRPEVADLLESQAVRIRAMGAILHGGLVARVKWLLFGA